MRGGEYIVGLQHRKSDKKVGHHYIFILESAIFIERLKKARALNCDPSSIGMNDYILKRLPFNKLNMLKRFS